MATNALSRNTGNLTKDANSMAAGLKALGASLEITQVTEAGLKAKVKAVGDTQADFSAARGVLQAAVFLATEASADIEKWLGKARGVLVLFFGEAWSAQWAAAGFTANSTAVPRTVGDRFKLIGQLEAFLTKNPGYEAADPKVNVTAAEAARLAGLSTTADEAVQPLDSAANAKKKERDGALDDLRAEMRLLIEILDNKLEVDDARWAEFGLKQPGADSSPAAPVNVTATVVEGPAILCECDAVATATRYRWRTRLAGAREFALAASTAEPMAQLDNVLPGQTLEIVVQAVDGSAQGVPSELVRVSVPATQPARTVHETASNATGENGDSAEGTANGAPASGAVRASAA